MSMSTLRQEITTGEVGSVIGHYVTFNIEGKDVTYCINSIQHGRSLRVFGLHEEVKSVNNGRDLIGKETDLADFLDVPCVIHRIEEYEEVSNG
jgi:hypothetical protein